MYRIPRKKKKQIPKETPYCYTFDEERNKKEPLENGGYWIKTCPFYKYGKDYEGGCKLVEGIVIDQVKICNQREGKW